MTDTNQLAKILPIRTVGYSDQVRGIYNVTEKLAATEVQENEIKQFIINTLFSEGSKTADYLLIGWDNRLFIVERDGEKGYCRREVMYHPLMEKVK